MTRPNINPIPDNKILGWSKLKAHADNKINIFQKIEICFQQGRKDFQNNARKEKKCWLPAFSSFLTMFSKGFYLRVVKTRDCLVKG